MDSTVTQPALAASAGEQCPSCGSPVASDQRYCVECGERQGAARFSPASLTATVPSSPAVVETRRRLRPPASSSTTLIAGVATLLVAMAVGVLIGRSGKDNSTAASAPVRVVTVGGAAATATPAAGGSSSETASAGKDAGKPKGDKNASAKATPTPAPTAVKTPPPTVKVGQPGKGPGYKNGKFTGDFFGP